MNSETEQLPPHSEEAERGILGCCILKPECIDECQQKLTAGSKVFYDERHQTIYKALCQLRNESEAIDTITLHVRLRDKGLLTDAGGIEYISTLPDEVPSIANLPYYQKIVWEKYIARKIIRFCTRASSLVQAQAEEVFSLVGKLQNGFATLETDETKTSDGKACADGLLENMSNRFDLWTQNKRSGLVTGFHKLDMLTDGLQLGDMTVVASRPSIGKTAFGLNIVNRVCLTDQIPTCIITLEMSREALLRRMCSAHLAFPMNTMRTGNFNEGQHQSFPGFLQLVKNRPLFVVDGIGGIDVAQIAGEIRCLVRKHGIKLVLIDYLQLVAATRFQEKRTYEVAEASIGLKAIARETKVAMVALAQLNRENEKEKGRTPKMSDLGDSKQIEQDADCICLLHRDRAPEKAHDAALFVAKQRDGEVGKVPLLFSGEFCRFENPSEETTP